METPVTVAILAAGLGTRMKSRRAKVLHEAGGKPLIGHVVDTALQIAPPERIFVIVGHQADEVRAAVKEPGVQFVLQAEQKGTGHALMVGREQMSGLDGLLLILYGDGPLISAATLRRLVAAQEQGAAAGTFITATMDDPTGYGRVLRDSAGRVMGIVEQKAAAPEQLRVREANMGLYCWRAEVFWKHLFDIRPDNPAREYYLTDLVELALRAGQGVEAMCIEDPAEVLGINTREELAQVDRILRDRTVRDLMLGGVTVRKPETVTIDSGVRIGMDTVVEPFAQILGDTAIGENCHIGACSILRDAELDDEVEVLPFTSIDACRLEKGAHAGPYARLRMNSQVGPGARVGNFVELKKTRLGRGAKAMHLTYLGDSEIGAETNIGAGTITCNYDGERKHGTRIGEGAFIGSNATLVAPIEIGDGAYVGAASVVTDPVPADALALGRARQVMKDGWAKRRREQGHK